MRQIKRVVVEGPDGCGKSTLIEQLMTVEFPDLFYYVKNKKGPEANFAEFWPGELEVEQRDVVPLHDRFFYSELVYGPVLRGRLNAETALIRNVSWFLRMGAFLIYCRPDNETIMHEVLVYPQMAGVVEALPQLITNYDILMEQEATWYGQRFFKYDWKNEDHFTQLRQYLVEYLSSPPGDTPEYLAKLPLEHE